MSNVSCQIDATQHQQVLEQRTVTVFYQQFLHPGNCVQLLNQHFISTDDIARLFNSANSRVNETKQCEVRLDM